MLFYALNYLCSIFDSSAENKALKKTSNSFSKQTKLTKWGEGISPVEIFAPPTVSLWKRETALGLLQMGLLPAAGAEAKEAGVGACRHSVQQGAQCGLQRSGHPHPHFACHLCCDLKQKGCRGGFSPHFVASLSYPADSYTVEEGLTLNTFLKACVRGYNCSNECMFDCFINF